MRELFLRRANRQAPIEPRPRRLSNGSGEAVWGRLAPAFSWPLVVLFCAPASPVLPDEVALFCALVSELVELLGVLLCALMSELLLELLGGTAALLLGLAF